MLKSSVIPYKDGKPIEGAKKGSGKTPTEAADSLFSNSIGMTLDLLSEGEIEGLVGTGFEGVFFNESQAELNGTQNFQGVTIAMNNGTQLQPALRGFDDVRTSVAVAQDLPPSVNKEITFPNDGLYQSVDITIAAANFFQVEDDGDTVGTYVTFVIELSEDGGAYSTALSATIRGKQRDEYQIDYRIPINNTAGQTKVRVRRTKADPGSLKIQDDITFKNYTKVTEHTLSYPNCAVVGCQFSAKQFGNKIPTRQYHVRGIKVQVPHNYDAVARTYNGAFNGSLTGPTYTNNPAWIFYDLVTAQRYGLGQFIDSSLIDKASLYKISQWCDELVYKGSGSFSVSSMTRSGSTVTVVSTNHGLAVNDFVEISGANETDYNGDWQVTTVSDANTFTFDIGAATPALTATGTIIFKEREPRWTCNTVINTRGDAFNILKSMVSAFRGILFWMDSTLWAQADQPRTPVKIVTNSNVIDGNFTYSGEANRSRASVIKVSWNDPSLLYRKAIEVYEDPVLIREIGWKPQDYGSFGCTSRGQARRLAKAILYGQEYESELVSYKASFDHTAVNDAEGADGIAPGDLIWIADSERGNAVAGGRLTGVSGSTLTLDRSTGTTGTGASIYLEHSDGTVETVACDYNGSTVTLTGSPVGTVAINDLFILIDSGFEAEPFRVIRVAEAEPHIFEVTAVRYDEGKFNAIYGEEQFSTPTLMEPNLDFTYVEPPVAPLNLTEGYVYNAIGHVRTIDVSWTASTDPYLYYYEVTYTREDGISTVITVGQPQAQIEQVRPGTYTIDVRAVNRFNIRSNPLTNTIAIPVIPGASVFPEGTVTGLALQEGGTTFNERDPEVTWTITTATGTYLLDAAALTIDTGLVDPAFRDFLITIRETDNTAVRTDVVTDTKYVYTYEQNYKDNGGTPLRTFKVLVQYRDIYNRVSSGQEVTLTNPAPTFTTQPTAFAGIEGVWIETETNSQPDFLHYNVYCSTSQGFTPGGGNFIGQTSDGTFFIPEISAGVAHYVRVIPVDVYGEGTQSNEISATPLQATNGLNNATVFIYQRKSTVPSLPSATTTYTFATGVLTGLDNGWSTTPPANDGNPLYFSVATASSSNADDTIGSGEWTAAQILAQDGTAADQGFSVATVFLFQRSASTPSVPSVSSTFTFATGVLTGHDNGWTQTVPAADGNDLWVTTATASADTATDSIPSGEWATPQVLATDGTDGAAGADGLSAYLTNEHFNVPAYQDGTVASYTGATGDFVVYEGLSNVSANFTLSTLSNPQVLTVNYTSQTFTVTGGFDAGEDTATLTIRATGSGDFAGVTIDKTFSLAKTSYGYEIVGSLPVTNLFEGRVVYLTTDNKLYRYTGSGWIAEVAATDITGQLTDAQLAGIDAAKLTTQIQETNIANDAITTPKISAGAVTTNEIAANTIVAGNIAALTITAAEIAAGTITASKIAADTITANQIAAGTITAAEMNITSLSSLTGSIGTLTSGVIRNGADTVRFDLDNDYLQFKDTTNMLVMGLPFGSLGEFLMWYGPQGTPASATDANGIFYIKDDGSAYFDGTLGVNNVVTNNLVDNSVSENTFATGGGVTLNSSTAQTILDITLPSSVDGISQLFSGFIDSTDTSYEGSNTTILIYVYSVLANGTSEQAIITNRSIASFNDENNTGGWQAPFCFRYTPSGDRRRFRVKIRQNDSSSSFVTTSSFIQCETLKK